MRRPEKLTIVLGFITAAMGLFYVVTASGIVVLGPEGPHQDPRWIGVLVGLIFLLGGAAVAMRGVSAATNRIRTDFRPRRRAGFAPYRI
jgi:amino acid transporter